MLGYDSEEGEEDMDVDDELAAGDSEGGESEVLSGEMAEVDGGDEGLSDGDASDVVDEDIDTNIQDKRDAAI